MLSEDQHDMLTPLVEPLSIRAEDAGESDSNDENVSDEVDEFAADAVDAEANRIKSARWLARSHRFGVSFDPNRPIFRVWTNIRGYKVHTLILTGVAIVMYSFFGFKAGESDEGLLDIFNLHVLSMLLAWGLMSDGLVAYRAGNIGSNSIEALRYRHRRLMLLSALCIICGVVSIIAHKVDEGHPLLPHTYHGLLGCIILLFLLPQVRIGIVKLQKLLLNQGKSFRWHGNLGQLFYSLFTINLALGFMEVDVTSVDAFWVFSGGFVVCTITVIAAMYQPTIFGGDQFDQAIPTRDITEHDVELVEYQADVASDA